MVAKLLAPIVMVIERVEMQRHVRPAVIDEVGLFITHQAKRGNAHRAVHDLFGNRALLAFAEFYGAACANGFDCPGHAGSFCMVMAIQSRSTLSIPLPR